VRTVSRRCFSISIAVADREGGVDADVIEREPERVEHAGLALPVRPADHVQAGLGFDADGSQPLDVFRY
jgi:hypothetical protein